MEYNSFKVHREARKVTINMLNSKNRFIKNIGAQIAEADICELLDIKSKIDYHWPNLWNSYL